MKFKTGLFIAITLFSFECYSSVLPSREQVDHWLSKLSSDDSDDQNDKDSTKYSVLPGPFYTPELGVGMGIAAVGLYRPDENDVISQDSSLALTGHLSSTGAYGLGFDNYNFFANDQWRFFLSGDMEKTPTYYWGTGYQAGRQKGNKEKYTIDSFTLAPKVFYNIEQNTYLGISWDLSFYRADKLINNSKFKQLPEGDSVTASGVGIEVIYDTRDFIPNPSKGAVINVSAQYYAKELASDQRFQRYHIMYGQYTELARPDYLLAYEVNVDLGYGNIPWSRMSSLGSSKQMRGYYEGQYRDRNMINTQIELRQKLDWRHGMVYWLGAGSLSHKTSQLGREKWLPSVGAGYRFEFQPRMNIRLDLGIGIRSVGFYFQVGEAF